MENTVKVFSVSGLLPTQKELDQLKADFRAYKEGGKIPGYFGRDGDFSRHTGARLSELRHLHLSESGVWLPNRRQYSRTSDRWLIYCSGFWTPSIYLLMAILEPNAHRQANNNTLAGLVAIAENFRAEY